MKMETNRQHLESFTDEELAIFLCHVIKSGDLTMEEFNSIQSKYKETKPADFESMLMWLRSPAY